MLPDPFDASGLSFAMLEKSRWNDETVSAGTLPAFADALDVELPLDVPEHPVRRSAVPAMIAATPIELLYRKELTPLR
ncbi:hypothetical protein GCM10028798_10940 [Humibacter antri]